jgi:hypothetical protein
MMARFVPLLLLLLAACDQTDPYERTGVWRPNLANEINLRAMVEAPSDLATATQTARADGGMAAAAVARLRHDQVRPLLDSGLARILPVNGGDPAAAPAPLATGAPP